MANNSTNRTINVYINDKDAGKTMKSIANEARKLSNLINRELTPGTKEYNDAVKRLGELNGTLANHRQNIRQASGAWQNLKAESKSVLDGLSSKVIWAAIIGFVVNFGKKIIESTFATIKLRGEIQRLTGLAGAELKQVTAGVAAIATTFEESNEKVALAVKRMMDFGLNGQEALKMVETGFLSGANASGELLDNIDEYASHYQDLNYSAGEFVEILKLQANETYKDFGSDFLKEFNILFTTEKDKFIERMQDVNANVEQIFSTDLINSIKSGELGAKESMNAIITEIEKLPEGSEKARASINKIFGTKGEDNSESFIRQLNDVTGNVENLIDTTNSLTIAQQRQIDFQKNVNMLKERFASMMERSVLPALSNMVGGITDYIEVPYSETLKEEQVELNTLVGRITDINISQKQRNALIEELQANYPNFLGNLDAEKVTNEQLTERLAAVNELYIQKIILQQQNETVTKANTKAASKTIDAAQKEIDLRTRLNKANIEFGLGLDMNNKSLEENRVQVYKALQEVAKFQNISGQKVPINEQAKLLSQIERTTIASLVSIKQKEKAENAAVEAVSNRAEILKNLGIDEVELGKYFTSEKVKANDTYVKLEDDKVAAVTKADKERKKLQDKELQDLDNHLIKLKETVAKYQDEINLSKMTDDESELERIRLKYDAEIEAAKVFAENDKAQKAEFNAQIVELERLRDEELSLAKAEQQAIKDEKQAEIDEADRLRREELFNEIELMTLDAYTKEFELLDAQYEAIINEAEQLGLDVTAIKAKWNEEREKINKKHNAEIEKQDAETRKTQLEKQASYINAYAGLLDGLATGISAAFELMGGSAKASAEIQRIATLIKIASDTAAAISSVVAAAATKPEPISMAVHIATGVGMVLTNIAKAKSVLEQKRDGGFTTVIGPDDGQTYNAQNIGSPDSGMLSPGPKLILANEVGQEYFVAHDLLNNPQVANHVAMIEAIRVNKQKRDGGFTNEDATTGTTATVTAQTITIQDAINLKSSIDRLNQNLENGLYVLLENETILDLEKRKNELIEIQDK